ncbi:hypothetical protein AB6A40_006624 [Gnathostoma spinigerum]|uniref:Uncharacterized protein n=1 Tax=Gnathostoma spinigerum TaxID=75299 RepID=A0ABD6EK32_9BILA
MALRVRLTWCIVALLTLIVLANVLTAYGIATIFTFRKPQVRYENLTWLAVNDSVGSMNIALESQQKRNATIFSEVADVVREVEQLRENLNTKSMERVRTANVDDMTTLQPQEYDTFELPKELRTVDEFAWPETTTSVVAVELPKTSEPHEYRGRSSSELESNYYDGYEQDSHMTPETYGESLPSPRRKWPEMTTDRVEFTEEISGRINGDGRWPHHQSRWSGMNGEHLIRSDEVSNRRTNRFDGSREMWSQSQISSTQSTAFVSISKERLSKMPPADSEFWEKPVWRLPTYPPDSSEEELEKHIKNQKTDFRQEQQERTTVEDSNRHVDPTQSQSSGVRFPNTDSNHLDSTYGNSDRDTQPVAKSTEKYASQSIFQFPNEEVTSDETRHHVQYPDPNTYHSDATEVITTTLSNEFRQQTSPQYEVSQDDNNDHLRGTRHNYPDLPHNIEESESQIPPNSYISRPQSPYPESPTLETQSHMLYPDSYIYNAGRVRNEENVFNAVTHSPLAVPSPYETTNFDTKQDAQELPTDEESWRETQRIYRPRIWPNDYAPSPASSTPDPATEPSTTWDEHDPTDSPDRYEALTTYPTELTTQEPEPTGESFYYTTDQVHTSTDDHLREQFDLWGRPYWTVSDPEVEQTEAPYDPRRTEAEISYTHESQDITTRSNEWSEDSVWTTTDIPPSLVTEPTPTEWTGTFTTAAATEATSPMQSTTYG